MKYALLATEVGMGLYWILALLMVAGVVHVPPEYMYSDYENPLVIAWNWSFLPIDLIFITSGIAAFLKPVGSEKKRALRQLSLTTMFCAGLMAITYWAILGQFDPVWWGVNVWLMVLPILAHFVSANEYA
jgi:hypothetical protein